MKSNSCNKKACRNRYVYRSYNKTSRKKYLKYKNIKNNTKYIHEANMDNNDIKRMITKQNRNVMYEYSKSIQKIIIYKKPKTYKHSNRLEPVKNKTSIKYYSTKSTHVNSKVLCTRCRSTKYVAYTWQLIKVVAERGYVEVLSVIYVCKEIAQNKVTNTRKCSTSDITEMAEKNGQMDVDPEGLMMYGPYGKPKMNIYPLVLYVCITLVRYNNPKTDVCKYGDSGDVSVRVWSKKLRYGKMVEGILCVYPESVVTKKWSARSKTVEIQSSSWHKEYGE